MLITTNGPEDDEMRTCQSSGGVSQHPHLNLLLGVLLSVHSSLPSYVGHTEVGSLPDMFRLRERAAAESGQVDGFFGISRRRW